MWCGLLNSFSWCACLLVLLRRLAACHKRGHFIIKFQVKQEAEPWRRTISFCKDARGCRGPPLNWYFLPKCHFLQFYSSVFLKLAFIIPTEKEAEAQDHGFIVDLHHRPLSIPALYLVWPEVSGDRRAWRRLVSSRVRNGVSLNSLATPFPGCWDAS